VTLNPARLARFTDWASTLPPRPLPRPVTPVPGEYYLDYISRLAGANHLKFPSSPAPWTTPPRSSSTPASENSTSRNVSRPPPASR